MIPSLQNTPSINVVTHFATKNADETLHCVQKASHYFEEFSNPTKFASYDENVLDCDASAKEYLEFDVKTATKHSWLQIR